jgi:glycosyl transferase family 2
LNQTFLAGVRAAILLAMPSITALLHTCNDSRILGRALETLYPCDEILIIDDGSRDSTLRIAHEYGARVIEFSRDDPPNHFLQHAHSDSLLCLEPRESLSEALAASLYEWKSVQDPGPANTVGLFLREETAHGWIDQPIPLMRLVPKTWNRWQGWLPIQDSPTANLEGPLLRFLTASK